MISLELLKYLPVLAQANPEQRRTALENVLCSEGFSPEIQQGNAEKDHTEVRNYLLPASPGAPCPLFCAHYDAYPGSTGANDNAAACCMLIVLAKELRARGIRSSFAFLDGEEKGHTGAKLFERERSQESSVLINLDMCGYGDTIVVYAKGGERKPSAAVFCDKKRLTAHSGRMVRFLPEGDEKCFPSRRQPVLSMSVLPRWDVKYLDAIAAHGGGLFGRPPEIRMMVEEMEVTATMHGGCKDSVDQVQLEAVQQMYAYLLDALCATPRISHRLS